MGAGREGIGRGVIETRIYFLLGDVASNVLVGAGVGTLAGVTLTGWPPWLAMAAGMLGGMIAAMLLGLALGTLFGAFEVMLPVTLTGMAAGMAIPMAGFGWPHCLTLGGGLGLLVLALTYLANLALRGDDPKWGP